jgi:hypothetical protein
MDNVQKQNNCKIILFCYSCVLLTQENKYGYKVLEIKLLKLQLLLMLNCLQPVVLLHM